MRRVGVTMWAGGSAGRGMTQGMGFRDPLPCPPPHPTPSPGHTAAVASQA